jgi:hypothetical protein
MPPVDLSELVTVFVISSGEPDHKACLAALAEQNSTFQLEEVKDVAPMDRAFQTMLDKCETPYYIQVDADMVLRRGAVLTMARDMQWIARRTPNAAMICYPLLDPHLGHLIIGVKIYRHDIMVQYPYTASYSCEVGQLDQLKEDGFQWLTRWPNVGAGKFNDGLHMVDTEVVMGQHSPTWTAERIFTRYKRLLQKWHRYKYIWLRELPWKLMARYQESGEALDRWAALGAMAGLLLPLGEEKELDFREADEDFERVRKAMSS